MSEDTPKPYASRKHGRSALIKQSMTERAKKRGMVRIELTVAETRFISDLLKYHVFLGYGRRPRVVTSLMQKIEEWEKYFPTLRASARRFPVKLPTKEDF